MYLIKRRWSESVTYNFSEVKNIVKRYILNINWIFSFSRLLIDVLNASKNLCTIFWTDQTIILKLVSFQFMSTQSMCGILNSRDFRFQYNTLHAPLAGRHKILFCPIIKSSLLCHVTRCTFKNEIAWWWWEWVYWWDEGKLAYIKCTPNIALNITVKLYQI